MLRSHSLILSMKINRSTISLNGLKFKSKIGLYDFERDQENNFIPMTPISQKRPIGSKISKIIDELGEDKVTQLSLLSTASNN